MALLLMKIGMVAAASIHRWVEQKESAAALPRAAALGDDGFGGTMLHGVDLTEEEAELASAERQGRGSRAAAGEDRDPEPRPQRPPLDSPGEAGASRRPLESV